MLLSEFVRKMQSILARVEDGPLTLECMGEEATIVLLNVSGVQFILVENGINVIVTGEE